MYNPKDGRTCLFEFSIVFVSPRRDSDPYDMRRKHYGTTPIKGEEGTLNNERSNSNCTLPSSKVYPLSTIQSSSEATMHIQASRPHLSHKAFSLMGSTTTLNAGPAKGMPSTDAVGEAGKPRPTHDFRSARSTPPAVCSRPRSPPMSEGLVSHQLPSLLLV